MKVFVLLAAWWWMAFALASDLPSENSTCEEAQVAIERLDNEIQRLRNLASSVCSDSSDSGYACQRVRRQLVVSRQQRVAWKNWQSENCDE